MSKQPFLRLYVGDIMADTPELDAEQFGCYCLLLFTTWKKGGDALPDDDHFLSKVARVSLRRWRERVRPALIAYFDKAALTAGQWIQPRLHAERAKVDVHAAAARRNGALGGRPKLADHEEDFDKKTGEFSPHVSNENNTLKNPGHNPEKPDTRSQSLERKKDSSASSHTETHSRDRVDDDAAKRVSEPIAEAVPAAAARPVVAEPAFEPPPGLPFIRIFDDARAKAYGDGQRRPWPNALDSVTANRWHDAGITPELAQSVLEAHCARMALSGKSPPGSLAFFTTALVEALAASMRPMPTAPAPRAPLQRFGDPVQSADPDNWRARLSAFRENAARWVPSFGPPPGQPGCMVPPAILAEMGLCPT